MKLKDLQGVCGEAKLMIHMQINILCRGEYGTPEEEIRCKLMLADFTLLKAELKEHIAALESILTVCKAAAAGRYIEDRQQCTRWLKQCDGCASAEQCDNFDGRDPHSVIAARLSELSPLSDFARKWILFQEQYQRQRRDLISGPGGLFGDAKIVMYQEAVSEDGEKVLVPMSDEESAAGIAQRDTQEDAQNESMARRLDQYELNRERPAYLCRIKGDLQEVAAIIEGGMPPQVRPGIATS
jgi:hypothetical protein